MNGLLKLAGGLVGMGLLGWASWGASLHVQSEAAWEALCAEVQPAAWNTGETTPRATHLRDAAPAVEIPAARSYYEDAADSLLADHARLGEAVAALHHAQAAIDQDGDPAPRTALLGRDGTKAALAALRRCATGDDNSLGIRFSGEPLEFPELTAGALLCDLALLKAQERLDAGDDAEALRLVIDALQLAADHQEVPLLITHAIGQSLATWALEGKHPASFDLSRFGPAERLGLKAALIRLEPAFAPTIAPLQMEAARFRSALSAASKRPGTIKGTWYAMTHPGEARRLTACCEAYVRVAAAARDLGKRAPLDFAALDAEMAKLEDTAPEDFNAVSHCRSILREDARAQSLIRAWANALAVDAGESRPYPVDAFGDPYRVEQEPDQITVRTESQTSPAANGRPLCVSLGRAAR